MKRSGALSPEFWVAISVSLLLHLLAAILFWVFSGFLPQGQKDLAVEWTWTTPSEEKSALVRTASDKADLTRTPSPPSGRNLPSSGTTSGSRTETSKAGTGQILKDGAAEVSPVKETSAGMPGNRPGASSPGSFAPAAATGRWGPSSGDTKDFAEEPGAGTSSGYALVPPRLRNRPPLRLPEAVSRSRLSGTVLLSLEILEDGRVGKIFVSRSSGIKLIDDAAKENAARWTFEPAWQPQGNKPVRVMTSVWVRFENEGS